MPRLGGRKLHHLLAEPLLKSGISIGRDSLFDLMVRYGLSLRKRKRRNVITTNSDHPFYKYPNLIKDLVVNCPNQLWVSDITYLRLVNNHCYLSIITDAYSRKIVGFCLHRTLKAEGPVTALGRALQPLSKHQTKDLIHHSDRGLQYCSKQYTDLLSNSGATISMTENGDPYENAIAERVNGILKCEFALDKTFKNYEEAQQAVERSICTYNVLRPHSSINYLTPDAAHKGNGVLPKKWKKRYETQTV